MKRIFALTLILAVIIMTFSGCGKDKSGKTSLSLEKDGIVNIKVSSFPGEYNHSFSEDDADIIVDYLSGLKLISDFEEDPDVYAGMTWAISIEYENGDIVTVYYFGNMFIRTDSGPWYKMNYDEAKRFDTFLYELGE